MTDTEPHSVVKNRSAHTALESSADYYYSAYCLFPGVEG